MRRAFFCFLLTISISNVSGWSQATIIWEAEKAVGARFEIDDGSIEDLSIVVKGKEKPIFGRWNKGNDHFVFRPIIPFTENGQYQLRSDDDIILDFQLPINSNSRVRLVNLYPSLDTVPENLLKIHLHFSAPMGEKYSEDFITITNRSGDTLDHVFLPLQPELWNFSNDQLTLWLDPGRIKRGLGPNLDQGQPLIKGEQYQIHISSAWRDRMGRPLDTSYTKTFYADAADRTKPDVKSWQMKIPEPQTISPLIVDLQKTMDYVLAQECLSVLLHNQIVPGNISLKKGGSVWCFTPENKWEIGDYSLRIESRMEDLAGNNLNRLFDQEIQSGKGKPLDQLFYYLSFSVK